jgi:hypothetical protein
LVQLYAGCRQYAGREAADFSGQICGALKLFLLTVALHWLEPDAVRRMAAGISVLNKASFFCGIGFGGHGLQASPSGHGDLEDSGMQLGGQLAPNLQQGIADAAPGSGITAALRRLSFKMVVRRLLPPSSSASVLPGRRLQVNSNLLASMPIRRPLSFGVVGSRHLTPSGHVPGGVVLDCIVACTSSGVGAGPDCISCVFFRVPSAKSLDLCVLFFYLPVLLVIMPLFNGSS